MGELLGAKDGGRKEVERTHVVLRMEAVVLAIPLLLHVT